MCIVLIHVYNTCLTTWKLSEILFYYFHIISFLIVVNTIQIKSCMYNVIVHVTYVSYGIEVCVVAAPKCLYVPRRLLD